MVFRPMLMPPNSGRYFRSTLRTTTVSLVLMCSIVQVQEQGVAEAVKFDFFSHGDQQKNSIKTSDLPLTLSGMSDSANPIKVPFQPHTHFRMLCCQPVPLEPVYRSTLHPACAGWEVGMPACIRIRKVVPPCTTPPVLLDAAPPNPFWRFRHVACSAKAICEACNSVERVAH